MPELHTQSVTNKPPYSADILIRQEGHEVYMIKENGYNSVPIKVEGGVMLKVTVSSQTLPGLIEKIKGHVALIE